MSCPFCTIASASPPSSASSLPPPNTTTPPAYIIHSTPHVLAFLDIMPITRGHVLITSRRHVEKISSLTGFEAAELGRSLPALSRAIMKVVLGESDANEADWNVVQNNGARAAQVVPHVHFHIIPRPKTEGVATLRNESWRMFGRGQREELDDEDAEVLVGELRVAVTEEMERMRREEGGAKL